ncbi:DUF4340 domain-containing protein, partial [Fulvivirga sp. RKSG066]|uniref:DUF4340 domain-containing protein n=1 Tax=Fulvivirga aurantia TaxID=2529383 RepID=UPI0012BC16C3
MQEKKNKKLAVILIVLVAVAVIIHFTTGDQDRIDVDKSLFAYDDVSQIDEVRIELPSETVTLTYAKGMWSVNGKHKADPQRVKVLFAVAKQVSARRPVAKQQADSLSQTMHSSGTSVTFLQQGEKVHKFDVLGDESRSLTYMTSEDAEEIYLTEIPGYRSYLAGIFTVDANGWRDPLVFDINWRNMQRVTMHYPGREDDSFDIIYNDNMYQVEQINDTDTTRLFDTLDDIARLYLNDYLDPSEVKANQGLIDEHLATIIVEDVGKNTSSLEVFG